jgi:hypothetical protein
VFANKFAGTPNITTYGPDSQNLAVDPTSVHAGLPVNFTGTVMDKRYQSDPLVPISADEYFIDAPGTDGTRIVLSPTDGSWGSTTEDVEGIVDTIALLEGQHYILMHGKNQNNIWGPFTAVFLDVTSPTTTFLPLTTK